MLNLAMEAVAMPQSNDKAELGAERSAFEARAIELATRAIVGATDAQADAINAVSFIHASQRLISAFAAGTSGKDGARGMSNKDIGAHILASLVFSGRAIEKGADAPHFASMAEALAYVGKLDRASLRNRVKDFLNAAAKVAARVIAQSKPQFIGAMQKPTEAEAFAAYREIAAPHVAFVMSEARKEASAKPAKSPLDAALAYFKKAADGLAAADIAALITAMNEEYSARTAPAESEADRKARLQAEYEATREAA
jgi:hypothetical protein